GDRPADLGHLQGVCQAGAVVVARLVDQHLRLVHQPAKGRGMHDAVAIALVKGPERMGLLGMAPAATLPRVHGVGGQDLFLPVQPIRRLEQRTGFAHGSTVGGPQSAAPEVSNYRRAALGTRCPTRRSYSASSDCTMTLVSASTGMKLVSPCQRGTTCQWRW